MNIRAQFNQLLQNEIDGIQHPRLWIAYSGGVDSHVVLYMASLFSTAFQPIQLSAIHVNHGLQKEADSWAAHCQSVCDDLGVPLIIETVDIDNDKGEGLEAAARRVRYRVFSNYLQQGDILIQGHHADDGIETFFLNLFRGSGPAGLASIPQKRDCGKGKILRPLIHCTRREIIDYACENNLSWIEDPSNEQTHFDRNFLRQEIIPVVRKRWFSLEKSIRQVIEHNRHSSDLLEELAEIDLNACAGSGNSLQTESLKTIGDERRYNLFRFWIKKQGYFPPGRRKLMQGVSDLLYAAQDRQPELIGEGYSLRRYQGEIFLVEILPDFDPGRVFPVSVGEALSIEGIGQVSLEQGEFPGLSLDLESRADLTIRFRQGGEICLPSKRCCHIEIKNLLREKQVPPWMRDRVPLLYAGEEIAAVGDLIITEPYRAKWGKTALHMKIKP